jgi:L-asparaginase/Glu-tRNA(Gln) amidotransferase subunit D
MVFWGLVTDFTNWSWKKMLEQKSPAVTPIYAHPVDLDVLVVRLYPGIRLRSMINFKDQNLRGVVFQTFGAGNGPVQDEELQEDIAELVRTNRVALAFVTECLGGTTSDDYETNFLVALGKERTFKVSRRRQRKP